MKRDEIIKRLETLKAIYHQERCYNFDGGIDSIINKLQASSTQAGKAWEEAAATYRALAGTKCGFSDVYVDAGSAAERVAANIELDEIRQLLWDTFKRI
ncbi:hypothetical protein [Pseudomonas sp. PSKL.D1]|uniref:hypothetical protein n=1 Tax=Pseudomonas sp. PSKL.D1 TaxID=3029060 RepID=UPI00238192D0|nr:hypothetical protein [Pseudomonas sp. PSKL.D1]WDY60297.1 hypothetical protein PVV54_11940 [Pseudomonas sp. PSKL.D1]